MTGLTRRRCAPYRFISTGIPAPGISTPMSHLHSIPSSTLQHDPSGIHLGNTADGAEVQLDPMSLLRHCIVLGASGSGKTVACKVIVEEAVRKGIPVIAIDPQGDIASLAEVNDDVDLVVSKGVPMQTCLDWYDKSDVLLWTPASSLGIPLSISPNTDVPANARQEDRIRAFGAIATGLASLVGGRNSEETAAAFSMILEYADANKLLIETLGDFADFLADPPRPLRELLDTMMDEKVRKVCEKAIRVKLLGVQRLLFTLGKPINVPALLGLEEGGSKSQGKTRVSVIYLNTLASSEEKEMFIGALCNAVYTWMLSNPSPTPQALFYIDEVAPYIPPVKKPACKDALMLMLRQSRKYGVCCLLATQSPGDLDYKALGQIGTWILGRMRTLQEAWKVEPSLSAQPGVDSAAIVERLPGFDIGQFVITSPDNFAEPIDFKVRWLVTAHKIVEESQIEELTRPSDRERNG